MKLRAYLFTVCFLFAANTYAQVYKCTFVGDEARQNKVVYTDMPCSKASKQTLTAIQAKSQPNAQNQQAAKLAQANTLDESVTRAVLSRDFALAKSLATTKEHWRLIAIAEGESAPQPVIVAANNQVAAQPVGECAEARESFESVSRTSWRDKDLVAAKRSVMYAACGVSEPMQNQPVYIGQGYGGYGGVHSTRWAAPYYTTPYNGAGYSLPPHGYRHSQGGSHAGSSVSLSYKSKHFGINAESFRGH